MSLMTFAALWRLSVLTYVALGRLSVMIFFDLLGLLPVVKFVFNYDVCLQIWRLLQIITFVANYDVCRLLGLSQYPIPVGTQCGESVPVSFWYGSGSRMWKNSFRIQGELWYGSGSRQKQYGSRSSKIGPSNRKIFKKWWKTHITHFLWVYTTSQSLVYK